MKEYFDRKTYSFNRRSSFLETILIASLGLASIFFSAMPREGRDYEGYLELFSNKSEIDGIRNLELISRLIYSISAVTDPSMGFIFFGAIACFYNIGIVKKSSLSNLSALYVFISFSAAYLIMGYGYYLRQFVALTVLGYAMLQDRKINWLHITVAACIHINTALMIFPVYLIYIVKRKFPILIIGLTLILALLTLFEIQSLSNELKLLVVANDISYGWYLASFDANPVMRHLYNLLVYCSISFLVFRVFIGGRNKSILLPFSWLSFVIFVEYFFSEFDELTNRVSFALDFFAIIILAQVLSLKNKYSVFAFLLIAVVTAHGVKKGLDVL